MLHSPGRRITYVPTWPKGYKGEKQTLPPSGSFIKASIHMWGQSPPIPPSPPQGHASQHAALTIKFQHEMWRGQKHSIAIYVFISPSLLLSFSFFSPLVLPSLPFPILLPLHAVEINFHSKKTRQPPKHKHIQLRYWLGSCGSLRTGQNG